MLNDLVVTKKGDVFVTDSFRPTLWRITAAQVAAGSGTPEGIPVGQEIQYDFGPFVFKLNGIVAMNGGRRLVVVQSNTGKLFRIDLDEDAPFGRRIRQIAVEPLFGDGLLLDRGELIVVTFEPVGAGVRQARRQDGTGEGGRAPHRPDVPGAVNRGPGPELLSRRQRRLRHWYRTIHGDGSPTQRR